MVKQIPDLPDNVIGFTAQGTITANDYESVIIPAVEASREIRQEAIRGKQGLIRI